MTDFVLTNNAKSDLKAIGSYTQKNWGKQQRDSYLTALDKSFQGLAANRLKGRDCSEIRNSYRKYQVGKESILFSTVKLTLVSLKSFVFSMDEWI